MDVILRHDLIPKVCRVVSGQSGNSGQDDHVRSQGMHLIGDVVPCGHRDCATGNDNRHGHHESQHGGENPRLPMEHFLHYHLRLFHGNPPQSATKENLYLHELCPVTP